MTDIETIQAVYAAMAAKDLDALFELLDPEIVITQDERLPWGGRFEGHDGFATFGLALTGSIASAVTIDAIFEADGDVIQMGHTAGRWSPPARRSTSPRSTGGPSATDDPSGPTSRSTPPACSPSSPPPDIRPAVQVGVVPHTWRSPPSTSR